MTTLPETVINSFLRVVKMRVISGSDLTLMDFWVWDNPFDKFPKTPLTKNCQEQQFYDEKGIWDLSVKSVTNDFWKYLVLLYYRENLLNEYKEKLQ